MKDDCYICGMPTGLVWATGPELCEDCEGDLGRSQFTVYKKIKLEVAHMLPGHKTCGKIHGHSVDVVIGIRGKIDLQNGMVFDFKVLKEILQRNIIDRFDHSYLNDTIPIPTAEYLAYYIYYQLQKVLRFRVVMVRVHETENNYVEYGGPDV